MRHNVHKPVLYREIMQLVDDSQKAGSGLMIDATLGEGGHSLLMLQRYPALKIVAFERDPDILEQARDNLKGYQDRFSCYNLNFSHMPVWLEENDVRPDYVLFDYGISSFHLEKSERGFSFARNEKLDMRLDPDVKESASDIINTYPEKDIADIIYHYGEERWSRRIARRIIIERDKEEIESTTRLAEIVLRAIPRKYHVRNIHPATRTFQAFRIRVNRELEAIEKTLDALPGHFQEGARIMAISFHSLEDRIVKDRFRRWSKGCRCQAELKNCSCDEDPFVRLVTRKPIMASEEEKRENSRARSARLRACEATRVPAGGGVSGM
jgi:16S rRNA (cytosine1402-N4)-methyltransferase